MAASLRGDDFGRLVDPFGGRRDLVAGRIRVLHNLSFIDDPTRIFRAVRYENRYGFRMDEHTARLARGCIEMGLVGDLSSTRLLDELEALLVGGRGRALGAATGRAGRGDGHPPASGGRRGGRPADPARPRARGASTGSTFPRGGSASPRSRGGCRPTRCTAGSSGCKMRRRDVEQIAHAVTVGPRLVERLRGTSTDRQRRSSRSPSRTRRTRRSSRSRSRTCPRFTATSPICAASASR